MGCFGLVRDSAFIYGAYGVGLLDVKRKLVKGEVVLDEAAYTVDCGGVFLGSYQRLLHGGVKGEL
jgi:hypothetical protein